MSLCQPVTGTSWKSSGPQTCDSQSASSFVVLKEQKQKVQREKIHSRRRDEILFDCEVDATRLRWHANAAWWRGCYLLYSIYFASCPASKKHGLINRYDYGILNELFLIYIHFILCVRLPKSGGAGLFHLWRPKLRFVRPRPSWLSFLYNPATSPTSEFGLQSVRGKTERRLIQLPTDLRGCNSSPDISYVPSPTQFRWNCAHLRTAVVEPITALERRDAWNFRPEGAAKHYFHRWRLRL